MFNKMALHYYGGVSWWGHSPCINICNELGNIYKIAEIKQLNSDELNILLVGSNDPRHILKTVAQMQKWEVSHTKIKFYIVEPTIEQLARQMLLLALATDPCKMFSVQDKATRFLEIFGNTLLSENAARILEETCIELIKLVTNFSDKFSMINTTILKYKERDELENVLKHWQKLDKHSFRIADLWDHRLRWHLGERYDFRQNIFDWDYQMKLKERGAKIITADEYLHWRQSGIAFTMQEPQLQPNTTFASYWNTLKNGLQCGFWGDMVTGPFISYGIEHEDESMFRTENGRFLKKSQDISLANAVEIMQSIEENASSLQKVQCYLLSPEFLFKYSLHGKLKAHFHLIYFGRNAIQYMNSKFCELLNERGVIMTETSRFMLEWNKANIEDVWKQTVEILKNSGCKLIHPCEPLMDNYVAFIQN